MGRKPFALAGLAALLVLASCAAPAPKPPTPTPKPWAIPTVTPSFVLKLPPTLAPTPPMPAPIPSSKISPAPTTLAQVPLAELRVHFIDVGQGDSILIDWGTVEVLIDGGPRDSTTVNYLTNCECVEGPLEVMVATHPHADHIGGLIPVLQNFQVNEIWHNGQPSSTKTYDDFMKWAQKEPDAAVKKAKRADVISAGELDFAVLNPPATPFSGENNNSIVLRLEHGKAAFLFTGDAEQEAENSILAAGLRIQAQVLKVGHHGSRSSSSKAFLSAVAPEKAIYMAGEGNSYSHPHQETIAALSEVGAQIYGTDLNGSINVLSAGEEYSVSCATGEPAWCLLVASAATHTPTATIAPVPKVAPSSTAIPSSLPYDPFGPDRDCGDFTDWQDAQAFYEDAGGPASDRHRLDGDGDGIACESLPGAPGTSPPATQNPGAAQPLGAGMEPTATASTAGELAHITVVLLSGIDSTRT